MNTMNRMNAMNAKIYDRNLSSQMLQPYLSVRPVMTKYSFMPIVDPRKELSVKLEQQPTYNSSAVFNPGNDMGPWNGYSNNVDIETLLRNQTFALQNCEQSVYVPSSTSDLYNSDNIEINQMQPYPKLFEPAMFDNFNPNSHNLGNNVFNNSTRQQLKNIV